MFSGIRYILGYTDEPGSASPVSGQDNVTSSSVEKVDSTAPTTVLEQTLNAATTKFTEQLLPAQASIDQLQSSSHQLLPSIIEQHEEEELKKKQSTELASDNRNDDDDDCFNAESWELLDLVEKAEDVAAQDSLTSSVQKQDDTFAQGLSKSTSGILKSTSSGNSSDNDNNDNNLQQQKRQKPKVSFETPDLVRYKQEIEQTKPKGAATLGSKKSKNKTKTNSVAQGAADCKKNKNKLDAPRQVEAEVNKKEEASQQRKKIVTGDKREKSEMPSSTKGDNEEKVAESSSTSGATKKVPPVLNYAKALSTKLVGTSNAYSQTKNVEECGVNLPEQAGSSTINGKTDANGPIKRVRPLSTSSWSSTDEDGDLGHVEGLCWVATESMVKPQSFIESQVVDVDDNESIISSGFSDCDYGFGGVNDYIMRPKKANSKRGRNASGSSSSNWGLKSNRKATNAKVISVVCTTESTKSENAQPDVAKEPVKTKTSSSSKNSKPKKKKMIMSTNSKPISSVDFLKQRSPEVEKKRAADSNSQMLKFESSTFLVPGTCSGTSNESSDIPEMDESWFVTPPPCFTGASKATGSSRVEHPKTKEADQENALIEHPSIYIARTSLKDTKVELKLGRAKSRKTSNLAVVGPTEKAAKSSMAFENDVWTSDDDDVKFDDDEQFMPIKKMVEVAKSTSTSSIVKTEVPLKTTSSLKAKAIAKRTPSSNNDKRKSKAVGYLKSSDGKAWKNKFIVDDWDLEDHDDVDSDFDDMYEPVKKRKQPFRTKRQKQKQPTKAEAAISLGSNEIATFENGASVELISVKSLSLVDIENNENSYPLLDTVEIPSIEKTTEDDVMKADVVHIRKPPTQVRPIEPERRPGWQLKRKRSKRRPLVATTTVGKQQAPNMVASPSVKVAQASKDKLSGSAPSSRMSTPTLIDRIGCSIVANLTNLTSGLVSSGAMNYCPTGNHPTMIETSSERIQPAAMANKPSNNVAFGQLARKQMSRGFLKRQNICAKQAGTLRRPDRRLRMFATPNGSSINRKVHTSIH